MQEIALVADLLIAMREGIKPKKQIGKFYASYEKSFDGDVVELGRKFDTVIEAIGRLYPEGIMSTEFIRIHLFYSLFTSIAHCFHTIEGLGPRTVKLTRPADFEVARNGLDRIGLIFENADRPDTLSTAEKQFLEDSRRATTDEPQRERRGKFLLSLMN